MNLDAVNQFLGSDWVYIENDCWAVVCKASRAVFDMRIHEIALPPVSDARETARIIEANAAGPEWCQVQTPGPGCVVIFRCSKGRAVHVGLYIDGAILHCPGSVEAPGTTRYDSLSLLRRAYQNRLEFYRYAPHNYH